MSDIALQWGAVNADLVVDANDLGIDEGLKAAVVLSLFTDRRALETDVLPDGHVDRRGWWGDAFAGVDGDRHGSRLWLLCREKQQPLVLNRAEEYAREALQWLVDDQVAAAVAVTASFVGTGILGLEVTLTRPADDPLTFAFSYVWTAQEARR